MEQLDLTSLEHAVATFDEIIERYSVEFNDTAIRDALIQRFEYTYSLSVKMLMRYLKIILPEQEDISTFNETIRNSNRAGLLLSNLEKWSVYRQNRNLSSHTYNEKIANDVANIAKDFQDEVHYLLEKLKANNAKR